MSYGGSGGSVDAVQPVLTLRSGSHSEEGEEMCVGLPLCLACREMSLAGREFI